MAYSSTVTVTEQGAGHVVVTITETEVAASSEATIPLGFDRGIVLKQRCKLTAESGTTIDPVLGEATDPGSAGARTAIYNNGTPAATINVTPTTPVPVASGTVYLRMVVDGGSSDNVTTCRLFFRAGF